jgi:hypothetical protein
MLRKWILVLAILLAPLGAKAGTCTAPAGEAIWSAVGTLSTPWINTSSCTPNGADTFVIGPGSTVRTSGDIVITTGKIQGKGGNLFISAGTRLQFGVSIDWQLGGFYAQGSVLATCQIINEPTWATAGTSNSVILDCPTASNFSASAPQDYIRFMSEDGAPGTPIAIGNVKKAAVWTGPGRPASGVVRAAYNELAWYPIASLTSPQTLSYTINQYSGKCNATNSGSCYAGNLKAGWTTHAIAGPSLTSTHCAGGTGTTLGATVCSSFTFQRLGFATKVVIAATQENSAASGTADATGIVSVKSDLGGQYIVFPEASGTNDSRAANTCAGTSWKIIYSTDGGAGVDDTVWVQGDMTGCGSGSFIITPGARRGDMVQIVRPATIDGCVGGSDLVCSSGTPTGFISVSGGTFTARWARFINFGATANTSVLDGGIQTAVSRNYSFGFVRSSATVQPTSVYLVDSDIAGFTQGGLSTDTDALGLEGSLTNYSVIRYGAALDATNFKFDGLYIHDAMSDDGNVQAGEHGFVNDSAVNFTLTRTRIERMTDAGLASVKLNQGAGLPKASDSWSHILIYENIAGGGTTALGNSQKCMEATDVDATVSGKKSIIVNAGAENIQDVIMIGCEEQVMNSLTLGSSYARIVTGGSAGLNNTVTAIRNFSINDSIGTLPVGIVDSLPNTLTDSLIGLYGTNGTATQRSFDMVGTLDGDVIYGNEATANTASQIGFANQIYHTFIDNPGASLQNYTFLSVQNSNQSSHQWKCGNSVMLIEGAFKLGTGYGITSSGNDSIDTFGSDHCVFYAQNAGSNILTNLGSSSLLATSLITHSLFKYPAVGANTATTSLNGTDIFDSLIETSSPLATAFGAAAAGVGSTDPNFTTKQAGPITAGKTHLRAFVGTSDSLDPTGAALPEQLGLGSIGWSFLLLGDGAITQATNFSSFNMLAVQNSASGTGGAGGLTPCLGPGCTPGGAQLGPGF